MDNTFNHGYNCQINEKLEIARALYELWDDYVLLSFIEGDNYIFWRELGIASSLGIEAEEFIGVCRMSYMLTHE